MRGGGVEREAARIMVELAAAQPFDDGNKRAALLAANISLPAGLWLTAPHDPGDLSIEAGFMDALAQLPALGL